MEIIDSGQGEFKLCDVDETRAWMRQHKPKGLVNKVMDEHTAIKKFVSDGDYLSYDLSSMVRGPMSLEREIIRQRKKDLWLAAKFTLLDSTILVGAGCVSRIDVGFAGLGRVLFKAIEQGKVKVMDWSNGTLALRHLAGAMGVPFLPTRALLGTDTFKHSGAKIIKDPFTGKKVAVVPAINPDVAIIHVNQCDIHGNARVFGPSITPAETAMASKKVIISTEEIIDTKEIKKNPGRTTIPYFLVDAVVVAPFGAHPGTVPGLYTYDSDHLNEFFSVRDDAGMQKYLDKYVYNVESHEEYIEQKVGQDKLTQLKDNETIKEGYYQ